jgi:hypothetical protein
VLGVPPPAVRAEMWGPVVIDDDSVCTKYTTTRGLVISIRISARFESSLDNTESSVIVIYG